MKCKRCKGKGWRWLTVGPHIIDGGQAVPGGRAKYDCLLCLGTGVEQKLKGYKREGAK